MIPGIVTFAYDHTGGWRVARAEWNVLPPVAFRTCRENGAVAVQGNFNRRLRTGTWCKRPHQELAQC